MAAEKINDVAVLGLGTMGSGIAQTFAAGGCAVRCYDQAPAAWQSLAARIRNNLERAVQAKLCNAASIPQVLDRIKVAPTERQAVEGAQFVIEAVAEDLNVKRDLFARLEAAVSPQTILATNTSTLSLSDMQSGVRRRERLVVAHWFNPPNIIPVVEVAPGPETSPAIVDTTIELIRRIGKLPVRLTREIPGFIVNRVQAALIREVWDLLDQGIASAEDIDNAIRGSIGFRLAVSGPLEVCDFGGLDIWGIVFENLAPQIRSDAKLPKFIREKVDAGNLGAKTGKGIYDYTPQTLEQRRQRRDQGFLALAALLHRQAG